MNNARSNHLTTFLSCVKTKHKYFIMYHTLQKQNKEAKEKPRTMITHRLLCGAATIVVCQCLHVLCPDKAVHTNGTLKSSVSL